MMDEPTLYDRFLVTDETKSDVGMQVPGKRLTDPSKLEPFLEEYARVVGADKLTTAASRFNYHMMRPMLRGPLYCLGRWRGRFTNVIDAVTYQEHTQADPGHEWGIAVNDLTLAYAEDTEDEKFRDSVFRALLDNHFGPVFKGLNSVTGIGFRTLWENLAHVLTLYYDEWTEEYESEESIRDNFTSDFRRLHDTTITGEENPLAKPLRSYSVLEPVNSEFERTTCCLNYRLEGYCEACPISQP